MSARGLGEARSRSGFDPLDERLARAAWSRVAEPGDEQAYAFVAEHGPGPAMAALLAGQVDVARWRVRLPALDPARELRAVERLGGRLVIPSDPQWPRVLDDLGPARPFCLWARGPLDLRAVSGSAVAIVGCRAATSYGEHVAAELGSGCAEHGVTVVSGAAYGIDGAAHRGALSATGPTVAVLACGVDRAYPKGHEQLISRITQVGAVITEAPPGSAPTRWRFLERNRLIAALAEATVVVEAAWRSGALGTANRALGLNRTVCAVPGPVTSPASTGCHALIRDGAVCVTEAAEIFELLGPIGADPMDIG